MASVVGHNSSLRLSPMMSFAKSFLAVLLCCAIALPGYAQTPELSGGHHNFFSWLTNNYVPHPLPIVSFEDSPRLEKLMRAGTIYLSLRDAIALALENNLDLEYARYNPKLSQSNLLRASAPALARSRLGCDSFGFYRAYSRSRLFSSASAIASRSER